MRREEAMAGEPPEKVCAKRIRRGLEKVSTIPARARRMLPNGEGNRSTPATARGTPPATEERMSGRFPVLRERELTKIDTTAPAASITVNRTPIDVTGREWDVI
jgi:hypothetical protein